MKRTVTIAISMLALAGLLLVAVQCDGGTAPIPTQPSQPTQAPGATAYPGPSSEPPPYPSGGSASPTPEAYPGGASGTPQGETLLNERCDTACHDLSRVTSAQKTAEEWRNVVTRMRDKGAKLDDVEATVLIEYLGTKYGK